MKNKNLLVVIVLLVVIFNSIVYSALNSEMFINGDAHVRVDKDIRITNVKVLEQVNNAYETYNSDYSKNTTSMQITLPSSESVMVYEVTITNKGSTDYEVTNIVEEAYSNNNIKYELVDIENGLVIDGGATHTFKIKFTTTENNLDNKTTLVLKYTFQEIKNEWIFDYIGKEQELKVPYSGVYKLEVWGSQGGNDGPGSGLVSYGGYGSYSVGEIQLKSKTFLYINVGSRGNTYQAPTDSYNGGGIASTGSGAGGGGATHISTSSKGNLENFQDYQNELLLVAGGGGGAGDRGAGGSGGGIRGVNGFGTSPGLGATQDSGYAFGKGENGLNQNAGGGGGYYGGRRSNGGVNGGAGGGSGYIGNSLLKNKVMYCYNCEESNEESTKTISTTNVSEVPISNYAKIGNGYAKITLITKK